MYINVLSLFLFLNFSYCVCQTGTNLKDLLRNLFTTNSYNKHARPKIDQSLPTTVTVDFYLAGISSLDEIAESFTTSGYLQIIWQDQYLTWTPSSYGNINDIYYSQDYVWKPGVSLQNGLGKMTEMGSTFINVNVNYNGTVTWKPFETFQTRCAVDTTFFPFDKQTCKLIFVCWGTKPIEVNMTTGTDDVQLYDDFASNGEWSVTKLSSDVDNGDDDVQITFSITIKRKSQYFVLNIMLPIVLLSVLNIFTFIIPCNGGERISYAITGWLAFAVFLTIVGSILPRSASTTCVIEVYLMLQILIGTLVVMISAVEIRISGFSVEENKIPKLLKRLVLFLRRKRKTKVESWEGNEQNTQTSEHGHTFWVEHGPVSWENVISAVDFILFWVSLIVLFLTTLICFCYVATG